MKVKSIFPFLLIVITSACVDRIQFDITKSNNYGIVVTGLISDQPGPYTVKVSKAFDIESKETIKTPLSVKHLVLSDDEGKREELLRVSEGVYQTDATGIRGQVGRVYTLRVELLDGKIYESIPDTLLPPGKMDSVYYSYSSISNQAGGTEHAFDIFVNASYDKSSSSQFMWNMIGTYQSETRAEAIPRLPRGCYPLTNGVCNQIPLCSGLKNTSSTPAGLPSYERIGPCECCACWYKIFNNTVVLSNNLFSEGQNFIGIKMERIPINPWIFMHKIHIEVSQLSTTDRSFRFWKTIKDQRNAVNSLFQPVSGKIPINFTQLSGVEAPVQGIFFAAAISTKSVYIRRENVPHSEVLPELDELAEQEIAIGSCLDLFPNATNKKPSYWID